MESTRGDLEIARDDQARRITRKGIEIVVDAITAEQYALLGDGWIVWEGELSSTIAPLLVDRDTDAAIGAALHPFAATGEQIGILRDQLVQILNALGMEATPDFARLNGIAVAEIEKARAAKVSPIAP
ncbi:MAG: hypothetical protein PHF64_00030 [Methanoregula sp.]|nr:hypothetical protein [Methanoregula sp.]